MKNAVTKLNNTELNGRKMHIVEDSSSNSRRRRRSVDMAGLVFSILCFSLLIFYVEQKVDVLVPLHPVGEILISWLSMFIGLLAGKIWLKPAWFKRAAA